MKQLLFLLFTVLSVSVFAQPIDSSKLIIPIRLNGESLDFIAKNMGEWGLPNRINLVQQITTQMQDTLSYAAQKAKIFTVNVQQGFVLEVYNQMSRLPEGVARNPNAEMKQALLAQTSVYNNAWLLPRLAAINNNLDAETERQIRAGYDFFYNTKNNK